MAFRVRKWRLFPMQELHWAPDFDDMSSFFPCEIDDAIQYLNLGYGAHAPKIVIL